MLGLEYLVGGHGNARDYAQAYFWRSLAATKLEGSDQGVATRNCDSAAERLEPAELATQQKRIATWLAQHSSHQE